MNDHELAPPGDDERHPDLAALAEEITARIESGERVDIDAIAALHPDSAAALRALLPTIEELVAAGRTNHRWPGPLNQTQ